MPAQVQLGDIAVEVVRKDIKNVHLSVHPPTGRVTISAPSRLDLNTIRVFAISKIEWIRRQQGKFQEQQRETPREFLDRESHYVWGRRYLLKVVERDAPPEVELRPRTLVLRVRIGADAEKKQAVLDQWYREQLKAAVPPLVAKWERLLRVKVEQFFVQRMKTKWGSCNHAAGSIRLNAELAKKPPECLEYVTVHEMVHLLEPTHNARFIALVNQFIPKWRHYRDALNRLPVRHEHWEYKA
jgi:predicted metal-dependent hydrolase